MPFPDSPRAIYEKNPLEQVICQLRFPSILKIDTQSPVEFQEKIRKEYPIFSEGKDLFSEISLESLSQLPQEVVSNLSLPTTNKMNYRFDSADGNWSINLTSNFLALTSKKYDRWENFRSHLNLPIHALADIYSPAFFSRIGLRYVDIIDRTVLSLENINWNELIQPYILGILSSLNIDVSIVKNTLATDELEIDKNSKARLIHGLALSSQTNRLVYIIDCDFFTEKRTEISDAFTTLDNFNHIGRRLFRWCITELLHNAMLPKYL